MTDDEARAADLALAKSLAGKLCSDCPPVGYPTDKTRCLPCPRCAPKALDDVTDIVLAYKPKPKSEPAKKRHSQRGENQMNIIGSWPWLYTSNLCQGPYAPFIATTPIRHPTRNGENQVTWEPSKEAVERAAIAIRDLGAGCAGDISNCGPSCWCMAAARATLIAGHEDAEVQEGWKLVPIEPTGEMSFAAHDVLVERQRQISVEGWTTEHDDEHIQGEIALAAAAYAINAQTAITKIDGREDSWIYIPVVLWPWSRDTWMPTTIRRDLIKAGALILAEIERLDRLSTAPPAPETKK